jgi:hypothetical protein
MSVLDGQQRLQSLYIGLKGSYEGRELYFNMLSGDVAAPDDIRYKFEFRDPARPPSPGLNLRTSSSVRRIRSVRLTN